MKPVQVGIERGAGGRDEDKDHLITYREDPNIQNRGEKRKKQQTELSNYQQRSEARQEQRRETPQKPLRNRPAVLQQEQTATNTE